MVEFAVEHITDEDITGPLHTNFDGSFDVPITRIKENYYGKHYDTGKIHFNFELFIDKSDQAVKMRIDLCKKKAATHEIKLEIEEVNWIWL